MHLLGNVNTLRYDDREARQSRWFNQTHHYAAEVRRPGALTHTRLLREQRWPDLAVQLFEEPTHVTPTELAPPGQVRLILLLSGALRVNLGTGGRQHTYRSAPGTVKLTAHYHPPYQMQWAALATGPVHSAHLYLPHDLLTRTAEAAGQNAARMELREGWDVPDPLLYELGRTLARELHGPAGLDNLVAETATQLLAAQLLRRHCAFVHELPAHRGKLPAERLRRLREYVQAHLRESIRLEELAAVVFLSPYHFCRVFKRTTGLTPHQFVIQQRLERAVALLRCSGLNVSQVAEAVGYASPTHFAQLLVRHTCRLPTEYLKERPNWRPDGSSEE